MLGTDIWQDKFLMYHTCHEGLHHPTDKMDKYFTSICMEVILSLKYCSTIPKY